MACRVFYKVWKDVSNTLRLLRLIISRMSFEIVRILKSWVLSLEYLYLNQSNLRIVFQQDASKGLGTSYSERALHSDPVGHLKDRVY